MKLIVVKRTAAETYKRLSREFADDLNVRVVWERRLRARRKKSDVARDDRRGRDRRHFTKPWNSLGYVVIQIAEERPKPGTKPPPPHSWTDPWLGSR